MNFDNTIMEKLDAYALATKEAFYAKVFARNYGLISPREQTSLSEVRVAIPGLGGVGGSHLITLVRTGVGKFHVSDLDRFEPANIQRQYGARVPDLGKPKIDVMTEQAMTINPYLQIKQFPQGISADNIDVFLDGVDLVLDGLDYFNFDMRRMLFNRAREKGIYVITAGPMGFSVAMLVFSPCGMSFDKYFRVTDSMEPSEKYLRFALGLAPKLTHLKYMDLSKVDFDNKSGPSLHIACELCSAVAATEAVRILLKRDGLRVVPHYTQFDPFTRRLIQGKLIKGNNSPVQRIRLMVARMLLKRSCRARSEAERGSVE